jgi:nicotinate-nucleotide adenylyltransferase
MTEAATPASIVIFGGTFDPVHLGHLILAEQARMQLRAEKVLFVPAAIPPHKRDLEISPAKTRVEMLELAIAGNPAFDVSTVELDRGGVSFTVETLRDLAKANPGAKLFLVVGGDSLGDLPTWREPDEIVRLASLAVAARPGREAPSEMNLPPAWRERIVKLEMPQVEIASREIRRRSAAGESVKYLVPAAVEAYLTAHRPYARDAKGGEK